LRPASFGSKTARRHHGLNAEQAGITLSNGRYEIFIQLSQ
jgi:hypothetical protein